MFSLFKYISKFRNLSVAILLELFDKLILPISCYLCEVWGFNKAKDIERVHLKFCKYILKMKTSTLNEIVYGEVGRYPLFIERYRRIVKYWLHITQTNECKYVKMIYNIMYQKIRCKNEYCKLGNKCKGSIKYSRIWRGMVKATCRKP